MELGLLTQPFHHTFYFCFFRFILPFLLLILPFLNSLALGLCYTQCAEVRDSEGEKGIPGGNQSFSLRPPEFARTASPRNDDARATSCGSNNMSIAAAAPGLSSGPALRFDF